MLNDQQLDTTDTERDLGLCVSSNLTWQTQVRQQVSKASRLLGYIRRNTMFVTDITPRRTLHLALVRSHFGYGTQIWAPQSIDLIWNGLADELHFNTDSLSVFKSILLKYYYQSLELNYDPDNPRTPKTICLKCNSVRSLARPVSCCY